MHLLVAGSRRFLAWVGGHFLFAYFRRIPPSMIPGTRYQVPGTYLAGTIEHGRKQPPVTTLLTSTNTITGCAVEGGGDMQRVPDDRQHAQKPRS